MKPIQTVESRHIFEMRGRYGGYTLLRSRLEYLTATRPSPNIEHLILHGRWFTRVGHPGPAFSSQNMQVHHADNQDRMPTHVRNSVSGTPNGTGPIRWYSPLATREPCANERQRSRAPLSWRPALARPMARLARECSAMRMFTPADRAATVQAAAACAVPRRAKHLGH